MTSQPGNQTGIPDRLAWFLAAKFGLFIHWGPYSAAGVEASWPIMAPDLCEDMFGIKTRISEADYTDLASRFNPIAFDAAQWVRTAQAAGMRYIIFTAKHHDGFCMFDAPGTDYKITNTPFGRDVCLELAQACAKAEMPLGFYYSPPDLHHPGYRDLQKPAVKNWLGEPERKAWASYLDYMESHIRHLLTHYGDVKIIWFDGLSNHRKFDPPRFHHLIHTLSPNTLINDRLGDGYDYITPEQFIPTAGIPVRTGKPPAGSDANSDRFFRLATLLYQIPITRSILRRQMQKYAEGGLALTPVQTEPYPPSDRFQPWETCMTMGKSWAYNPDETDWKSVGELIANLVRVISHGGNFLLNVGPTPSGAFPPEAVQRLQAVGRWVNEHPEAVFGCTYAPPIGLSCGQAARKGNKIYIYITHRPEADKFIIEPFPGSVLGVCLYGGEALKFNLCEQGLEIFLPPKAPDPDVTVLEVVIDETESVWKEFSNHRERRQT